MRPRTADARPRPPDRAAGRTSRSTQDCGAPIGWRLALRIPAAVTAIVSQNGNAYDEGFVPEFWAPVWAYAQSPTASAEAAMREALTEEAIRWQYATQVPLLAIWDAEDEIFGPDGARAFARDLKDAEIRLVPDGGHYLLESHLDTVADAMRTFLGKHAA